MADEKKMVALADGQGLLADMFEPDDVSQVLAERQFKRVDLDLETEFRCPCCGYEWSGNPKPTKAEADEALNA